MSVRIKTLHDLVLGLLPKELRYGGAGENETKHLWRCQNNNEKVLKGDRIRIRLSLRYAWTDPTKDNQVEFTYQQLPMDVRKEVGRFILTSESFQEHAVRYSTQAEISGSLSQQWSVDLKKSKINWDAERGVWTLDGPLIADPYLVLWNSSAASFVRIRRPIIPLTETVGHVMEMIRDGFHKSTQSGPMPLSAYGQFLGEEDNRYRLILDARHSPDIRLCIHRRKERG